MEQKIGGKFYPDQYWVDQRKGNEDGEGYVFELQSRSQEGRCPSCGEVSRRQHSYQVRRVQDLPILGEAVTLLIWQQRYYCDNEECGKKIFTENNEIVDEYVGYTKRCREYMTKVAIKMPCEAAVKILKYQGIRVSGDTLLNMVRAAGVEYKGTMSKTIGVDDWAYRKGHVYGTLICDMETHDIIDVLEGRDSETLKKWLLQHPEIEKVSRDRSGEYASAISAALPEAVQIADRFHITKNLLDALTETMKGYMPEVISIPGHAEAATEANGEEAMLATHTEDKTEETASKKNSRRKNGKRHR